MADSSKQVVILLADDDPDDREMTRKALARTPTPNELFEVEDGELMMDFLNHRGRYAPPARSPTPDLILLDLNMPKKDGREALAEIKADPALRRIPVVVLTTSNAERDIVRTYELGCNSFVSKSVTLSALVEVMSTIGRYWFDIVKLPGMPRTP